ncbi:MAG: DUF3857 domain-containing protein [Bacteroides sp.]|nr:DUF3857 domain-containing protein [Bacteroides sp.]
MKNYFIRRMLTCMIVPLLYFNQLNAQAISTKYGKVTDEEVTMTTYPLDSAATAVVMYKNGITSYDYINNEFRVNYDVEVKIKILKQEGAEYADVTIPYYQSERSGTMKEVVSGIDASAYNMENGKVVRTKMKRDYIFRERLNSNYMQVKFSIPAVKAGTVIEYKYRIISDFYHQLNSWDMQQEIPVMYSRYELTIPEYFKFNLDMRGAYQLQSENKNVSESLMVQYQGGSERVYYTARQLIFTGNNLPALESDSYVWYPDDYKSKINFELSGIEFPGAGYRSFLTSWEQIDKLLLENEDFGRQLKMRNPFRDEMQAMALDKFSTDEKIVALFNFLKQKITWDESYALFGRDIRKAIKEGKANNAVLNFILISMLKDAGIQAYPLIMSRRDRGIIPFSAPSINKINTFVVGIQNTDSTYVFLDGSVTDGYLNILPPVMLVDRARIIREGGGNKWVDLREIGNSSSRSHIKIAVQENGEIQGTRLSSLTGQYAASFRKAYKAAKDSTEFIEKTESHSNIQITAWQQKGVETFTPQVSEEYSFTREANTSGDYIYINPMMFKHISENPFVQEDRKLPVEFSYPYTVRRIIEVSIPDNYEIEELPQSAQLMLEDKTSFCRYIIQQRGNTVVLNYTFTLNKLLFPSTEYAQLKEYWSTLAEKNEEMIVLKKKSGN